MSVRQIKPALFGFWAHFKIVYLLTYLLTYSIHLVNLTSVMN